VGSNLRSRSNKKRKKSTLAWGFAPLRHVHRDPELKETVTTEPPPLIVASSTLTHFLVASNGLVLSVYSQTSIYILNWSKMDVLIAKSCEIEVWIPIDLHVKLFNWSMTFPKKIAKI
jgi:hypothetical protein